MASTESFFNRHYLVFRRLQSLTGIVPIGVFLIAHLTTNSTILWGAINSRAGDDGLTRRVGTFQHEVEFINNMPFLILIEIGLWSAIAYHALFGIYYARTGKRNTAQYAYQDNWRYTLQRLSGYAALIFIFYHVATLRWGWTFLVPGGTKWSHEFSASTFVAALRGSTEGWTAAGLVVALGYFVGITASVYHFANGLWTAAITWGLTVSEQAQRRWGYACLGLGVMLMGMAWGSLGGFAVLDYQDAREVELRLHDESESVAHAE